MAGNIFINYRRGDDPGFTQALFSRLEQSFPPEQLFMDVDNIAPGLDFVQVLNDQVARCDVLIAVIGKNWLGAADETGDRRLDNPEDFVRIEIESALAQKKRVIPVLVNDAKMPRSTELPESLKPFARCNAVRLTHERFRADTQGLIKALEQVLTDAEAARRAEEEDARRAAEARAKDEAERLRQERHEARKRHEAKPEAPVGKAARREPSSGVVGWIAGLPSEISWSVPMGVVAILLLGWLLPTRLFQSQLDLGSGLWSLTYALTGLLAIGAMFYVRRNVLGGAELALYWFAAVSFYHLGAISLTLWLKLAASVHTNLSTAAIALLTAVSLITLRRAKIGGLEFAVYWFGLALILFWGTVWFAAITFGASELGAYFAANSYIAASIMLAGTVMLSALGILLWRNRRLNGPEAAVYLLGIAYMLYVAMPLS
jgi:hypothetical protein